MLSEPCRGHSPLSALGADHDAFPPLVCDDECMPLTLLIVDDHEEFRGSARALLEAQGFEVVGEAADGSGAVAETMRLRPDVVILDIQLPDMDGFVVAERIAALHDPPAVVLVSSREAAAYGLRLSTTPARGFISKSELSGESVARLVA